MQNYDVLIVGNGVAAKTLLFHLNDSNLSIGYVSADHQNPPCSKASTGVVCLNGIQEGISPLGDKLFQSYFLAKEFFEKRKPKGIEKAVHFYIKTGEEGSFKVENRFGSSLNANSLGGIDFKEEVSYMDSPAFLINSNEYLSWLDEQIDFDHHQGRVEKIDQQTAFLDNGNTLGFKKLIIAAGAYIKTQEEFWPSVELINKSSVVAGTFATFNNIDWGNESLVFSMDNYNLIYRASDHVILLGGTTTKSSSITPDIESLKTQYQQFSKLLDRELPTFEEAEIKVGLRHKGKKREPFWGEVSNDIYSIMGLYKNGWTLSFLAANELEKELKSALK